jgi:hypothetical protein
MSNSEESRNVDLDAKSDATDFQQANIHPAHSFITTFHPLSIRKPISLSTPTKHLIEYVRAGLRILLINERSKYTKHFFFSFPLDRTSNDTWHAPYDPYERLNGDSMNRLPALHPAHPSSRLLDTKHCLDTASPEEEGA